MVIESRDSFSHLPPNPVKFLEARPDGKLEYSKATRGMLVAPITGTFIHKDLSLVLDGELTEVGPRMSVPLLKEVATDETGTPVPIDFKGIAQQVADDYFDDIDRLLKNSSADGLFTEVGSAWGQIAARELADKLRSKGRPVLNFVDIPPTRENPGIPDWFNPVFPFTRHGDYAPNSAVIVFEGPNVNPERGKRVEHRVQLAERMRRFGNIFRDSPAPVLVPILVRGR